MVNEPDPDGASRPATVTLKRSTVVLAMIAAGAAVVTVAVVVSLVMFNTREGGTGQQIPAPMASSAITSGAPATAPPAGLAPDAFGPPVSDVFGRRVDVPKNPAGQALPQQPGSQRKPGDPDWLTAAPAGTKAAGGWQRVYGVSVPFSTSDGPGRIEDGLALGFARTPQGAALAMVQIYYRQAARPANDAVRDRQFVLTPEDKAAVRRSKSEGKLPERIPESAARYLVAPDAFKVMRYSPDTAIIRIAGRGPSSTWFTVEHELVWIYGDWRWKPPPGSTKAPAETITSLEGWTSW